LWGKEGGTETDDEVLVFSPPQICKRRKPAIIMFIFAVDIEVIVA